MCFTHKTTFEKFAVILQKQYFLFETILAQKQS